MSQNEKYIYNLINDAHAISAADIIDHVNEIDRATVYRIIKRLVKKGLIREIIIDSEKSFFETLEHEHHHHIVCKSCKKIIPIDADNNLENQIQKIEQNLKNNLYFKKVFHSLNFYGICSECC